MKRREENWRLSRREQTDSGRDLQTGFLRASVVEAGNEGLITVVISEDGRSDGGRK